MTDNLRIWSQVEKTDPNHTKKVNQRGGFTAISAAYQIKRATETFGPIGEGWGYGAGEPIFQDTLVFVPVTLWHGDRSNTFGPMFGGAEWKNGNRIDSDALKKATTDALTKLLSQLGFNADVFLGLFDDNKYVAELKAEFSGQETPVKAANQTKVPSGLSVHAEGKDWWGCEGFGPSAAQAKRDGLGEDANAMKHELSALCTAAEWRDWCRQNTERVRPLPQSWRIELRNHAEAVAVDLGVDLNAREAA